MRPTTRETLRNVAGYLGLPTLVEFRLIHATFLNRCVFAKNAPFRRLPPQPACSYVDSCPLSYVHMFFPASFFPTLRFRCCGLFPFMAERRKPQAVTLGSRVLRSDVAVNALLTLAHAWVDERAVGEHSTSTPVEVQLPEQ